MRELLAFTAGFALLAAASAEAQGMRHCGARAAIIERLADRFGESRQSIGLGANNAVMELYASEETGTWTIALTMPNGVMCLLATGRAFEALDESIAPAKGTPL